MRSLSMPGRSRSPRPSPPCGQPARASTITSPQSCEHCAVIPGPRSTRAATSGTRPGVTWAGIRTVKDPDGASTSPTPTKAEGPSFATGTPDRVKSSRPRMAVGPSGSFASTADGHCGTRSTPRRTDSASAIACGRGA